MNFPKRHPYVFAEIIATILSVVVWCLVPKEYAAQTKIIDEYTEVDLAIGLDKFSAKIREMSGAINKGVNDIEVYCLALTTDDFARKLAQKRIDGKGVTYGEYLAEKDTIGEIKKHIDYNLSTKTQTITIQFTDRDPLVAAQMLDSVVVSLQDFVTSTRRSVAEDYLKNAEREKKATAAEYHKAQRAYANFVDSHFDEQSTEEIQARASLENEVSNAFNAYQKAVTQYARQKALTERSHMSFAVLKSNEVPHQTNSYFIGYFLLATFCALCIVKGTRLYRAWRKRPVIRDFGGAASPWNITLIIWGVLMVAMPFRDPKWLNAPSSMFYTSLALWLTFFCLTSFATYVLLPANTTNLSQISKQSASPIEFTNINKVFFNLFFWLSIIITPLYIKKIMDVVLMFGTDDFVINLRYLAVYGNQQSFLNYSIVLNETLLIVGICAYPKVKLWKVAVTCTACLLNALAIMEKGGVLLVVFCIVFILYQRKYIKTRTIVIIGVAVVLLSYGFNIFRESSGDMDIEDDGSGSLMTFIAMYLLSPPVAYCTLHRELVPQFGAHTFPMVYFFLNKFCGGHYEFFDRLQEAVYVPVLTNVYTVFQPFYMDFGQFGIAVFAAVYGIMTGCVYRAMRNGNAFGKCLYMYFAYVLVLQFFQEYIFTGNMHLFQLIFFIYLCTQSRINVSFGKRG